jgi:hypothetical protein
MTTPSQAAAASRPVNLIDGTQFLMSPLTKGEYLDFNEWLQEEFIRRVRHSQITSVTITIGSSEGKGLIKTRRAAAQLLLMSCKGKSAISHEQALAAVREPENLGEVMRVFEILNTDPTQPAPATGPAPGQPEANQPATLQPPTLDTSTAP